MQRLFTVAGTPSEVTPHLVKTPNPASQSGTTFEIMTATQQEDPSVTDGFQGSF